MQKITNSTTTTKFYNIDDDDNDEEHEQRQPTINEKIDHIKMSLEHVKYNDKLPHEANN